MQYHIVCRASQMAWDNSPNGGMCTFSDYIMECHEYFSCHSTIVITILHYYMYMLTSSKLILPLNFSGKHISLIADSV